MITKKAAIQILEDLVNEVFGDGPGSEPDIYKMDYDDLSAFSGQCREAVSTLRKELAALTGEVS